MPSPSSEPALGGRHHPRLRPLRSACVSSASPGPAVGGRRHHPRFPPRSLPRQAVSRGQALRADLCGVRVPGRGARRFQPAHRGVVDGGPSSHRTGPRSAEHGDGTAPARGGDPSFQPRHAVSLARVRRTLPGDGVRPSTGSVGDCHDNAMAESFFATLGCELIDRRSLRTRAQAKRAVFDFVEGWYNPGRRHGALGYLSPNDFERAAAGPQPAVVPCPNAPAGGPDPPPPPPPAETPYPRP